MTVWILPRPSPVSIIPYEIVEEGKDSIKDYVKESLKQFKRRTRKVMTFALLGMPIGLTREQLYKLLDKRSLKQIGRLKQIRTIEKIVTED